MDKFKKVSEKVRYLLWAKSAGRCEFNGCNQPIYEDQHTRIEANFGEVAHIIGKGEKGPRDYINEKLKKEYVNNIENLMLLCKTHHSLVDDKPKLFPVDDLRKMKKEHEERIRLSTSMTPNNRSNVIIFRGKIGSFQPSIEFDETKLAMFPNFYPADDRPHELGITHYETSDDIPDFWQIEEKNLVSQFTRKIEPLLGNGQEVNHYSIFAFAPIPLLIKLGTLLPNKYPAQVYQLMKQPATWSWQDDTQNEFDFSITRPEKIEKIVALNLSLGADILNDRIYQALGTEKVSIWTIDAINTLPFSKDDHLRSKSQLEKFKTIFRILLNEIKKTHGQTSLVNIFPTVGVAYAVEMGRCYSEKADLPMVIFDENKKNAGFFPAISIGVHKEN